MGLNPFSALSSTGSSGFTHDTGFYSGFPNSYSPGTAASCQIFPLGSSTGFQSSGYHPGDATYIPSGSSMHEQGLGLDFTDPTNLLGPSRRSILISVPSLSEQENGAPPTYHSHLFSNSRADEQITAPTTNNDHEAQNEWDELCASFAAAQSMLTSSANDTTSAYSSGSLVAATTPEQETWNDYFIRHGLASISEPISPITETFSGGDIDQPLHSVNTGNPSLVSSMSLGRYDSLRPSIHGDGDNDDSYSYCSSQVTFDDFVPEPTQTSTLTYPRAESKFSKFSSAIRSCFSVLSKATRFSGFSKQESARGLEANAPVTLQSALTFDPLYDMSNLPPDDHVWPNIASSASGSGYNTMSSRDVLTALRDEGSEPYYW